MSVCPCWSATSMPASSALLMVSVGPFPLSKRVHTQKQKEAFLTRLYAKDPDAHALLRQPKHTHHTPLAQPVCASYLSAHFCPHAAAQIVRAGVGLTARNMVVPV
eukprot:1139661-Pelagomonas_calceolata.AAC.3